MAHSEKMIVRSGDKVTAGCFMEFAEGVDITAKGERSRRVLDQIDATVHPASFYKDMTSMERLTTCAPRMTGMIGISSINLGSRMFREKGLS